MFELIVLLVGAMPFVIGLYALKMIKKSDDRGSDDQPPPPDPGPPQPVTPPAPRARRHRDVTFRRHSRLPAPGQLARGPRKGRRVPR